MTIREVREAIEKLIMSEVELRYEARLNALEKSEDGYFEVKDPPPHRIVLRRDHCSVAGPDLHEVMTLAHEHGHFLSFAAGRPEEYEVAVHRFNGGLSLTAEDKIFILEEEWRAWSNATLTLRSLGFEEWSALEARTTHALNVYRELFGLPRVVHAGAK